MNISLDPGRYVVAVSGGVDSMALLHALYQLSRTRSWKLTVAHFDHGIRPDSRKDMLLVQRTARQYGLPFVYAEGNLGQAASEAQARDARYGFLHKIRGVAGAEAIITAHHKDDVLETAVINLIRGTGRKGLSSLQSIDGIKRPLLHHTKVEVLNYASTHGLIWREDSTNNDPAYLRNHIRNRVLTRLNPKDRDTLHGIVSSMHRVNAEVDELLADYLQKYSYGDRLKRHEFIMLPHAVAMEVMAAWLRQNNIRTFDKKMLERLTRAAKIHTVGRQIPISSTVGLKVNRDFLALVATER